MALSSGVFIQETTPTIRSIPTRVATVVGVVGITERGPIGEAKLTTSITDWERIYGSHTLNNLDVVEAVKAIYSKNETAQVLTSRVVHTTVQGDPTSKTSAAGTLMLQTAATAPTAGYVQSANAQPYNFEPGYTLVIAEDGGGPATVTFTATAASRQNGVDETFALSNGQTLTVVIDQGTPQSIAFLTAEFVDIANATAEEVAAVINAKLVGGYATVTGAGARVTIWSDRRGTGSYVEVTGGTANTALQFNTAEVQGTGNVSNIDAVTAAEVEAAVDLAGFDASVVSGAVRITSGTTGGSSSMQVQAASTADTVMGFDNAVHSGSTGAAVNTLEVNGKTDGAYASSVTVRIGSATSGIATEFKLQVLFNGVVQETFDNVTMDDALSNYVETVVNNDDTGSRFIQVVDQDASPVDMPNSGTFGPLTGGNDGLGSLADTDYVGGTTVNGVTGLSCFDEHNVDILIVPGRATSTVHNAMVSYAELNNVYPLLDPPAGYTAAQMVTYVTSTASLYQLSEFGEIHWPRIKVTNPNKTLYGSANTVTIAPSGDIAAVMVANDQSKPGGYAEQPAGTEVGRLSRAMGLETDEVKKRSVRDLVFPKRINPISKEEGTGIFLDGSQNLKGTADWPSIGQRRIVSFVEKQAVQGLAFARHRNITDDLLEQCRRTMFLFLSELTFAGAFSSTNPSDAFVLDFGPGVNTPITKRAQSVYGKVGLATATPAVFVFLLVSNDTRALDEAIAAQTA